MTRLRHLAYLVVLTTTVFGAFGPSSAVATASGPTYPATRPLQYATTPQLPRPEYLQPATDPTFGTQITRVSDQTAMGVNLADKQYLVQAYAKKSAWNSDGSLLLLGMNTPAPLLNGRTYTFNKMINQPGNATWSNTRPTVLFGVQSTAGNLVTQDVTTGVTTVELHLDGYTRVSLGDGEGNLSDDDRWVVLHGTRADGTHDAILYDRTMKTTTVRSLGAHVPNWIGMSHSGRYIVINWNANATTATFTQDTQYAGVSVYDQKLGFLRALDVYNTHGDVAYDTTGREVYVAGNDCKWNAPPPARCTVSSAFSAFPLDGTRAFPLLAVSTGYNARGEHVSGRALKRPGWVYISDDGVAGVPGTYAGHDVVLAVQVNPAGTGTAPVVQTFAHTHHQTGLPYATSPFGVPDTTGARVLFGSEWNMGSTAPSYAYVAEQVATSPLVAKRDALATTTGGPDLGTPTGYETPVGAGRMLGYENGAIYWSAATGAKWLGTELAAAYRDAGGPAGLLGFPVGDQQILRAAAGGPVTGYTAVFEHGTVSWSTRSGSVVRTVLGAIGAKWMATGRDTGVLGVPIGPETSTGNGIPTQAFTNGTVYAVSNGTWAVTGPIEAKYAALGGPAGPLGMPTRDVAATTKKAGQYMTLTGGEIYWSATTGAHPVSGLILVRWRALGAEGSVNGFPTTDPAPIVGVSGATAQSFQNGAVYASPTTSGHAVTGVMYAKYVALGGPASRLGLPTSDEYGGTQVRTVNFVGGFLDWTSRTGVSVRYR